MATRARMSIDAGEVSMGADDGDPGGFIRMAFVVALCVFVLLVDLATSGAIGVAQFYAAALLPLYGVRRRYALAAFWLFAILLIVGASARLGQADRDALAARAVSIALVSLIVICLGRISGRERELLRLALVDPLTGAFNRRSFLEFAGKEEARARRGGNKFAVLMIDIDHFKRVNDTYGHPAGDRVIKSLADICARTLRPSDVIARYGGEEFVVNLPDTDQRQASLVAERLRFAVADAKVPSEQGPIAFTVSIGVATCSDETPLDAAIAEADKALYRAKKNGRNRVEVSMATRREAREIETRAIEAEIVNTNVVLVVDDETEIRDLLADWLSSNGYAVRTADSAAQALGMIETDSAIGLIFTDIVMPGGLDGVDLGRQAELIRPGIKMLYMSGYAASAVLQAARTEHTRVLHKPFRLDHVLESVRYALQH
jgi:diguanylate cyclase (GGDEF)-like protein